MKDKDRAIALMRPLDDINQTQRRGQLAYARHRVAVD